MFDTLGITLTPTTEEASLFNYVVFLHKEEVEAFIDRFISKPYDVTGLDFIHNNNNLHGTVFNNRFIHKRIGLDRAELAITNTVSKLMRGDNVITVFDNVALIVIDDDLSSIAYLENCVRLAVDMVRDEATEETVNFDFIVSERNLINKIKSISNKLWANLTNILIDGRALFILNRA